MQSSREQQEEILLTEQCKETEENNKMGKTKNLFKKNRDIKGTFNAKMGTKMDRNCIDLKEEEEVARLCRIVKKTNKQKNKKTS